MKTIITVTPAGYRQPEPILRMEVPFKEVRMSHHLNNVYGRFTTIRVYDPENRTDFEGDPCSIVRFDVLSSYVDDAAYPSMVLYGYIEEMCWDSDVEKDRRDPGWAYTPAPMEGWKPGLYKVAIMVQG